MAAPYATIREEMRAILRAATRPMTTKEIFDQSQLAEQTVQISAALSQEFAAGLLDRERIEGKGFAYSLKGATATRARDPDDSSERFEDAPDSPATSVALVPKPPRPARAAPPVPKALAAAAEAEAQEAISEAIVSGEKAERFDQLPLTLAAILRGLGQADEPLTLQQVADAADMNRGEVIFDLNLLTAQGIVERSVASNGQYRFALRSTAMAAEISAAAPSPALTSSIREAATRADQALTAYVESKADPILSALVAGSQQSWRTCAIAGVTP